MPPGSRSYRRLLTPRKRAATEAVCSPIVRSSLRHASHSAVLLCAAACATPNRSAEQRPPRLDGAHPSPGSAQPHAVAGLPARPGGEPPTPSSDRTSADATSREGVCSQRGDSPVVGGNTTARSKDGLFTIRGLTSSARHLHGGPPASVGIARFCVDNRAETPRTLLATAVQYLRGHDCEHEPTEVVASPKPAGLLALDGPSARPILPTPAMETRARRRSSNAATRPWSSAYTRAAAVGRVPRMC